MGTKNISAFRARVNWSESKKAAKKLRMLGPNFCSCSNYARSEFRKSSLFTCLFENAFYTGQEEGSLSTYFSSITPRARAALICLFSIKYGLLIKLFRSRWLDIGQVPFLRVHGPRRSRGLSINSEKKTRPISSHLVRKSLVNKGFIIWL